MPERHVTITIRYSFIRLNFTHSHWLNVLTNSMTRLMLLLLVDCKNFFIYEAMLIIVVPYLTFLIARQSHPLVSGFALLLPHRRDMMWQPTLNNAIYWLIATFKVHGGKNLN
ncbi:MAG: hypothetical protein WAM14_04930 [Candidatus Nitrosopolaris sp.]